MNATVMWPLWFTVIQLCYERPENVLLIMRPIEVEFFTFSQSILAVQLTLLFFEQ